MLAQRRPLVRHLGLAPRQRDLGLGADFGRARLSKERPADLVQLESGEGEGHAGPAAEDRLARQLAARAEPLADILEVLLDLVRRLETEEREVAHEVVVQREELQVELRQGEHAIAVVAARVWHHGLQEEQEERKR